MIGYATLGGSAATLTISGGAVVTTNGTSASALDAIDGPAGKTVPAHPPRRFGHLVGRGAAGEARRHDASRADPGEGVNRDSVLTQDLQNAHVGDAAREPAAQRESDPGNP